MGSSERRLNRRGEPDTAEKAGLLLQFATLYVIMAFYPKAIGFVDQALYIYTRLNDKVQIALCYGYLANIHSRLSDFDQAVGNYHKLIEYGL